MSDIAILPEFQYSGDAGKNLRDSGREDFPGSLLHYSIDEDSGMGLLGKLGLGGSKGTLKMPLTFRTTIRRKTTTQEVTFDVDVKGYFAGKAGKPNFFVEEITVVGIPGMNLRSFIPKELDEIKKQALRFEYPKLIGRKPLA